MENLLAVLIGCVSCWVALIPISLFLLWLFHGIDPHQRRFKNGGKNG